MKSTISQRVLRVSASIAAVAAITFAAHRLTPVNATTVGFAYLLLILVIASTWGIIEASISSIVATLIYNFYFLPPVGTFTIADPQNWIALFSFLSTALIASRLSVKAERRAIEAIRSQQDLERLYTFSRAILLIGSHESFPRQLITRLADIFGLAAATLYERRSNEFYRAGPSDFEGLDEQLRDTALLGTSFSNLQRNRMTVAVRLGSEPIASLALQGVPMTDSVIQGIANLVAIGLERARAQELAHEVEAARQSEQLRTALIDAMAHELKTPLTSIKAAATSLLASPEHPADSRNELLKIANEEADHLNELIDNAVEMARLDIANIKVQLEPSDIHKIVRDVVASMRNEIDNREFRISDDDSLPTIPIDQRLVKLALKQLIDNALKYSSPHTAVEIRTKRADDALTIDVTDSGTGIPPQEQNKIFERFYRGLSVRQRIPGSGLGLNIASRIARAHNGDLSVRSQPGETTFRLKLPVDHKEAKN